MGLKPYKLIGILFSGLLLLSALPAQAETENWVGADGGWWDTAGNWSPSGVPAIDDEVSLINSGASNITVNYQNLSDPLLSSLQIDAGSTGTMTLSQAKDSLQAKYEYIGYTGTGTFTQSGGTNTLSGVNAGSLYLGRFGSGNGTYNLSGTGVLSANWESIGEVGTGEFNHSGGTNDIFSSLVLGQTAAAHGTYNLSDTGELLVWREYIGYDGTGTFTQNGGTNTLSSNLYLGYSSTGSGTYSINGGTATVGGTASLGYNSRLGLQGGSFTAANMTIAETSYLTGGAGGGLEISGNFTSSSTQNIDWDTDAASLFFSGGSHDFSLTGLDLGASLSGYEDNFAWGTVSLDSASSLNLLDGGDPGGALYVGAFLLGGGTGQIADITGNGLNIYYKPGLAGNGYLFGGTYSLQNGGFLTPITPIPEPSSLLLLGAGMLGLLGFKRKSGQDTV